MEWKEVIATDYCYKVADGTHDSPKRQNKGRFLITSKHIKGPSIDFDNAYYISEDDYQKIIKRSKIDKWDVIVSMIGEYCGFCYLEDSDFTDYAVKNVGILKVGERIKSLWLYYYLNSPDGRNQLKNTRAGSSQPYISLGSLRNLLIPEPPRDVMESIVTILSSIDRKIELNNKINADLEEMAQAIFKNWFVDFEPFKDGKFVDSELGMIPEEWKVVTLDDLTSKFGTGLNPRKNFVLGHGNNYYVTIKNMGNNRIYLNDRCDKVDDEALAKINKRSKLQKGDLLFSGIGTIGRVAMVVDDPINWNTSESVFNMHPIDTVSSEFIYLLLLSDKFQQYVQQNAQGGVQQGIRMASLKAFQLAIPDDLNLFDNLVKPIISKIKSNDKENDTLSLLRDTLLPRLMSGEIEIPE